MAASTNQQSASVIVTDDPRTRAKTLLLRHELWRRRQERPPFPHRYAERRQRSGSLPRIHQAPRSHHADLYRLYQKAAEKIEEQGGRNLRVVLDYEMKKRLYRDLAKLGPDRDSSKNKHLVAERHGFQVVRGKIPVPDIRIEYEARDGDRARVDLELATSHYRGRSLAEKVRAGFSIYAHAEDASKLRRVLDQRELTAEILSL